MPVPESNSTEYERNAVTLGRLSNSDRYPAQPNQPFYLVHHTDRRGSWEVEVINGEPVWLPVFSKLILEPGANNIPTPPAGRSIYDAALTAVNALVQDGAVVLNQPSIVPTYLDAVDCRAPADQGGREGTFYVEKWMKLVKPLPGKVARPKLDRAAYNAWRLDVLAKGLIGEPNPAVLDVSIEDYRVRLKRLRGERDLREDVQAELVTEAAKELETVQAAKLPTAEPAPAKGKRGAQ